MGSYLEDCIQVFRWHEYHELVLLRLRRAFQRHSIHKTQLSRQHVIGAACGGAEARVWSSCAALGSLKGTGP